MRRDEFLFFWLFFFGLCSRWMFPPFFFLPSSPVLCYPMCSNYLVFYGLLLLVINSFRTSNEEPRVLTYQRYNVVTCNIPLEDNKGSC